MEFGIINKASGQHMVYFRRQGSTLHERFAIPNKVRNDRKNAVSNAARNLPSSLPAILKKRPRKMTTTYFDGLDYDICRKTGQPKTT